MGTAAPPPTAGPVVLRVKLRYPDVPTFIDKFAVNIGRVGMFLPTRALQPPGTELRFELRLADEQVVLSGMGRVASVVTPDERGPQTIPGMAIEFQRMTRESRDLVMRLLEYRRERGLGEPALPSPEASIEEAASRDSSEALPMRGSPPPAQATSLPAALPSPLPAEPARRQRRPLAELIADLPPAERSAVDLEDDGAAGGLARARERARALAEREVDSELAELLRPPEPTPIDAAAAAAELARQLGMEPPARRLHTAPLATSAEGTTPKIALARRSSSARGSQPPSISGAEASQSSPPTTAEPAPGHQAPHAEEPPTSTAPAPAPADGKEDVARRPRVARPQRLTRPASVFARRASPTQPPEPSAPEPTPAVMHVAPESEPTSGFERVLAELEETELPARAPSQRLAEDPLDRLAMEELAGAGVHLHSEEAAPSADALDLGALGESAFEILLEEDLDDGEPPAQQRAHEREKEPSAESSASIPTWRRTAGFDPLESPFDIPAGPDLTPPTIPGRIPTQELDLESALEALDLGADDLPTPPTAAPPPPAANEAANKAPSAPRSATAEFDDLAVELELDEP